MGRVQMAFANREGEIFDHPHLNMLGWDGECWRPLGEDDVEPLPDGSDLFTLPGRLPAGYAPDTDEVLVCDEPGALAVSAFLAPAYLRTYLPAYERLLDAPTLPLFAYSALGILDGELVAPALRVDEDVRQDPLTFDFQDVCAGVEQRKGEQPGNRLVSHLEHCATVYHCRAAQNFFLGRFEAPMPAAPTCNAACVGCISAQSRGGDEHVVAPHDRIPFALTPEELAEVALAHIARVGEDAVVSFGQGCEGEPLVEGENLIEAVRLIRRETTTGVVNLNTNASRPDIVRRMCDVGLDSIRISTNSARVGPYAAYYRPSDYGFAQVQESARVVRDNGGYVMLNYLVFPGFTDTADELEAVSEWIDEAGIQMVQLRNLNIDPERYLEVLAGAGFTSEPLGMIHWLREVRRRFPALRFGYFNPPRSVFEQPPPQVVEPTTT